MYFAKGLDAGAVQVWHRLARLGITVPDEDLYEMGVWPSRFNPDHKWTFTILKAKSWSPCSINILDLLKGFAGRVEIEKIELIRDFYRDGLVQEGVDQTLTPVAECSIEWILRKL